LRLRAVWMALRIGPHIAPSVSPNLRMIRMSGCHVYSRTQDADKSIAVNLPRPGKPGLADHAAGTGGDFDPSTAGVNSAYLWLELGSLGVARWQQQGWIT
jgi:hypothetical protein